MVCRGFTVGLSFIAPLNKDEIYASSLVHLSKMCLEHAVQCGVLLCCPSYLVARDEIYALFSL